MIDLRQSLHYADHMRSCGWVVETVPTIRRTHSALSGSEGIQPTRLYAYIRRFGWLPLAIMKIQRFSRLPDFIAIEQLAHNNHVISISLEPGKVTQISESDIELLMSASGYRKSRWPMLPPKTLVINLTKSYADLFADMKKDARRSITKARLKSAANILRSIDQQSIERFHSFWRHNGRGYIPPLTDFVSLLRSFEKDAYLVECSSGGGHLLSGCVILVSRGCAYYCHAVTSSQGRSQFSGYLTVWEAMREAKRRGCRLFDLEGVYDPRFPHLKRWRGFSSFKRKFGGEEITYPGPFVRTLFPFSILSTFGL